jgi:hypothetical protein
VVGTKLGSVQEWWPSLYITVKVVYATKGRNKAGAWAVHLDFNDSVSDPYPDWIRSIFNWVNGSGSRQAKVREKGKKWRYFMFEEFSVFSRLRLETKCPLEGFKEKYITVLDIKKTFSGSGLDPD